MKFQFYILALISLLFPGGPSLYSAEPTQELEIGLMPFTLRDGEHETDFPLRLTVTINNLTAARTLDQNQQNLQMRSSLRNSGKLDSLSPAEIKKLNDRHPSVLIPVLNWGSDKAPLASLLKFEITDESGKALPGKIRPLAATSNLKGPFKLDGVQRVMLEFGLDADQMKSWPKGTIHIIVKTDHTPLRPGSTQILFKNQRPWFWNKEERIRRTYLTGLFYRIDAQWKQVDTAADEILALKDNSPFGWELRGESALASKKYAEAEKAFRKAMEGSIRIQQEQKDPSPEFPSYHANRLQLATHLRQQSEKTGK